MQKQTKRSKRQVGVIRYCGIERLEDRRLLSATKVVDLLALYSDEMITSAGSEDVVKQRIVDGVNATNFSLANTGVQMTVRLVGMIKATDVDPTYTNTLDISVPNANPNLPPTIVSGLETDLTALGDLTDGVLDEIPTFKTQYGADLVTLLTDPTPVNPADNSGTLGISYLGLNGADLGYSVVNGNYVQFSEVVLAHELGHNFGAAHDVVTDSFGQGYYPYSRGYKAVTDGGTGNLIDIMSYSFTDMSIADFLAGNPIPDQVYLPVYANPNLLVGYDNSTPFGITGQTETPTVPQADLAKTFQNTRFSLANYSPSVVADVAPEAHLWQTSLSGTTLSVTVQYTDDSAIDLSTVGLDDLLVVDGASTPLVASSVTSRYAFDTASEFVTYQYDVSGAVGNPLAFAVVVNSGQVADIYGNVVPAGLATDVEGDWAGGSYYDTYFSLGYARALSDPGTISLASSVEGSVTDFADIYRLDYLNGGDLTLDVAADAASNLLVQVILDSDTNFIWSGPATAEEIQTLTVNAGTTGTLSLSGLAAGHYYLRVTPVTADTLTTYTLNVTQDPAAVVSSAPVADAGGTYTVDEGQVVTLDGSTSTGGAGTAVVKYEWDLDYTGGVFNVDALGATPDFSAVDKNGTAAGNLFTIALRVTDALGQTSLTTTTVTVNNVAPTLTLPSVAISEKGGVIIATGLDVSADQGTLRYYYDFNNDGDFNDIAGGTTSSTVAIPDGLLPDGNSNAQGYTYAVMVVDQDGASATTSQSVTVANIAPTATLQLSATSVNEGDVVTVSVINLVDSSFDLSTITYSFDVDGDGIFTGATDILNSTTPTFSYAIGTLDGPSTRTVNVLVSDKDGGTLPLAGTITIANVAPVVSIAGPSTVASKATASYTSTVTDVSNADTVAGFTYAWTVLKGTAGYISGTGSAFSFVPVGAGTYTVTLVVTDKDGSATTTTSSLVVPAPTPPTVSISAGPSVIEGLAQSVSFTLTLSSASETAVSLNYLASASGGLTLGTGLAGTSGTVTFLPGVTSLTLLIPIADNTARTTGSQAVTLTISNLTGATASGATSASVAVGDNDASSAFVDSLTRISVSGSAYADNVLITPGVRKNTIQVYINGVLSGTYFNAKRITVDLGDGDDQLLIDNRIKIPAEIFGGNGNDKIVGGSGRDIVVGGAGNDVLSGGKGDNLLIADDLAYGLGTSTSDQLFTSWNGKGSTKSRLSALRTTGAPLSATSFVRDNASDRIDLASNKTDFGFSSSEDQQWLKKGRGSVLVF